jgi:hypothetical protein
MLHRKFLSPEVPGSSSRAPTYGASGLQPQHLQERRTGSAWKMEYFGGWKHPGAPERRKGVPTPSLPAQEHVDHPEQESEQRGGVVGRSRRMVVRRSAILLIGRVLYRGVFKERDVRDLV